MFKKCHCIYLFNINFLKIILFKIIKTILNAINLFSIRLKAAHSNVNLKGNLVLNGIKLSLNSSNQFE